jgi:hypothetical protein
MIFNFRPFLILLTLLPTLALLAPNSAQATDFGEVYTATKSILAGRVFQDADGNRLSFGAVNLINNTTAQLTVKTETANGQITTHFEVIDQEGMQTRMSKVVAAAIETFSVTVSAPFNVLSIRPLATDDVEFLSRDCIIRELDLRMCYIKTKVGNQVFMSTYKEIPSSDR